MTNGSPIVSDDELRSRLSEVLDAYYGVHEEIVQLNRRPSEYTSSFSLEELEVCRKDQPLLALIFKNLSRVALLGDAKNAKPSFLHDPRREIEVYRSILPGVDLGTATLYGAVCEAPHDRYWLFIERIDGEELYQIGEFSVWLDAARWLARLHSSFQAQTNRLVPLAPLVTHDRLSYESWMRRAESFWVNAALDARAHEGFARLSRGYPQLATRLSETPATLLHGDFYASNVLVQRNDRGMRVCPIDWEMAGIGPGLLDLAALTAGKWDELARCAMALAYYESLTASANWFRDYAKFCTDFEHARLHLAVQRLGWSENWSAPASQAHDWLSELLSLVDRLGL